MTSFLSSTVVIKHLLDSYKTLPQSRIYIKEALGYLLDAAKIGGTIWCVGNGGSASQASHFAAEMIGIGVSAISLSDFSVNTALSNDFGYEEVFSKQLKVLGSVKDCLLAISTSGKSKNIIRALEVANEIGMNRILLTGGGKQDCIESKIISVPSGNTQRIQEVHLIILHHWFERLMEEIKNGGSAKM